MGILLIVLITVLASATPAVAQVHCFSYSVGNGQRITDCQDDRPRPAPDNSPSMNDRAEQRERLRILELQRQLLERQLEQQEERPRVRLPAQRDDDAALIREATRECLKSKYDSIIAAMERKDDTAVARLEKVRCP
jgi:hypothetical protein